MTGRTFPFVSADGTVLRGWSDDAPEGVPLVISNGLGAVPEAWPALLRADSGYRTVTWYHRGTFGSDRPADPDRIGVDDHVDDLVALLDACGLGRVVVASWSIGVNVAFELAARHPERVAGLLAVAGVPGGSFDALGAPLRIPRPLRRPVATGMTRTMQACGPALTWLSARVPVTGRTASAVAHTGFMLPAADPQVVAPLLEVFLRQDWGWYAGLARAAGRHELMDLAFVRCPVTLVAGRHDVLTSVADMQAAADRIPHAQVEVLPGSHFLTLEHPGLVHEALDRLVGRTDLAAPAGGSDHRRTP